MALVPAAVGVAFQDDLVPAREGPREVDATQVAIVGISDVKDLPVQLDPRLNAVYLVRSGSADSETVLYALPPSDPVKMAVLRSALRAADSNRRDIWRWTDVARLPPEDLNSWDAVPISSRDSASVSHILGPDHEHIAPLIVSLADMDEYRHWASDKDNASVVTSSARRFLGSQGVHLEAGILTMELTALDANALLRPCVIRSAIGIRHLPRFDAREATAAVAAAHFEATAREMMVALVRGHCVDPPSSHAFASLAQHMARRLPERQKGRWPSPEYRSIVFSTWVAALVYTQLTYTFNVPERAKADENLRSDWSGAVVCEACNREHPCMKANGVHRMERALVAAMRRGLEQRCGAAPTWTAWARFVDSAFTEAVAHLYGPLKMPHANKDLDRVLHQPLCTRAESSNNIPSVA
jgi:hypothetical protein